MELTLSVEDVQTFRGLLDDYLPELKFEVARAIPGELRHALVIRQNLCERLVKQLRPVSDRTPAWRHDGQ